MLFSLPPSLTPQARFAGQVKQKWLLVNVQDSSEFASQVLNRDVWSNHNVKEVIRQYFIFWQVWSWACSFLITLCGGVLVHFS